MQGIFDYRGECFGYIANNMLYDLEGNRAGHVTPQSITALNGVLVWHVAGDGLYDLHWQSIGYIGSPQDEGQYYED